MVTTYGVSETGFIKKTHAAITDSLHSNAQRMFGSNVDLTPGSPIKILIDLFSIEMVGLWTQLETVYNSAFLSTATGESLDNLGQLVGATRTSSIYSTGTVTFFRNTALTTTNPVIIAKGTKVTTADIRPREYITTESVYFQPSITAEQHIIVEPTYSVDAVNMIHSIQALVDDNAVSYLGNITFSGRTITFNDQIDADTILYLTYIPLSVTAAIKAVETGSHSNVSANTVTVLETPLSFVHYISNESSLDTGADVESDSHFRNKIIGATQSIGKATTNSLKYYIGNVTDVKNVIIEDPLRITATSEVAGNGTVSFYIPHAPIYSITSVIGSVGGTYTIESFDAQSGEVTVTVPTNAAETLVVTYIYVSPGKIKVYVEGGTVGDEFTEDTIVYAIESTRAAGIQAVGYDSDDSSAYGSVTAPFSWFYRPNNVTVDMSITVYFDSDSSLADTDKSIILTDIRDILSEYINSLTLDDKIYKNKIYQLIINAHSDIVDAQITSWKLNNVDMNTLSQYLQAGSMELYVCGTLTLSKAVG